MRLIGLLEELVRLLGGRFSSPQLNLSEAIVLPNFLLKMLAECLEGVIFPRIIL